VNREPRFPGLGAVSGLIAVLDPRGRGDGAVRARLGWVGDGEVSESGPITLASRGLGASAWWSDEQSVCVLDGRLHERESLASALGLGAAAGDAEIAALAAVRWGERAPGRLRGSYAYVVWIRGAQHGWMAQDHLGGRSLYVLRDGPRWIVASELRLVLDVAAQRPGVDPEGVIEWLGGRAMHDGQMLHLGVRRYGGAHAGKLDARGVRVERYWSPRYEGERDVTREEAGAALRDALRTAIRRHVLPGERVGTLLSGGLDSTAVAAGIAKWCADLGVANTAYSTVIPKDEWADESDYLDIATRELNLPGWRVVPNCEGALWHALWYQDAFALPLVTPGTVIDWHLVRRAAEDGAVALLDGQGGDEVFGHEPYLLADLARRGRWMELWRLLHATPSAGARPAEWQYRSMLRSYAFRGNTPRWYDVSRPDEREIGATCLRKDLALMHHDRVDPFAWKRGAGPRWWAHQSMMMTKLRDLYWLPDLLRRRGRLEGIEIRSPLLDVDLAETMLRLPPRYAFDPELDRALLRDALRGVLPEAIRTRQHKSDYAHANHTGLMRLMPAFTELLGSAGGELHSYVDRPSVQRLLRVAPDFRDPASEAWGPQVWTLATAEMWLRAEAGRGGEVRSIVEATRPPGEVTITAPRTP